MNNSTLPLLPYLPFSFRSLSVTMLIQCVIWPEYSIEKAVTPIFYIGRIQAKDIITPRILTAFKQSTNWKGAE